MRQVVTLALVLALVFFCVLSGYTYRELRETQRALATERSAREHDTDAMEARIKSVWTMLDLKQ